MDVIGRESLDLRPQEAIPSANFKHRSTPPTVNVTRTSISLSSSFLSPLKPITGSSSFTPQHLTRPTALYAPTPPTSQLALYLTHSGSRSPTSQLSVRVPKQSGKLPAPRTIPAVLPTLPSPLSNPAPLPRSHPRNTSIWRERSQILY